MTAALTQEAPGAGRNHLRGLVLNQTVGLAAAVCTVAVVVRSPAVRARLLRSALGSRVVGWLAEKTSTIAPADVLWVVGMMACMTGWTVLLQRVMAPGGEVSRAGAAAGVLPRGIRRSRRGTRLPGRPPARRRHGLRVSAATESTPSQPCVMRPAPVKVAPASGCRGDACAQPLASRARGGILGRVLRFVRLFPHPGASW